MKGVWQFCREYPELAFFAFVIFVLKLFAFLEELAR